MSRDKALIVVDLEPSIALCKSSLVRERNIEILDICVSETISGTPTLVV